MASGELLIELGPQSRDLIAALRAEIAELRARVATLEAKFPDPTGRDAQTFRDLYPYGTA
jgi:hypothetical protein